MEIMVINSNFLYYSLNKLYENQFIYLSDDN